MSMQRSNAFQRARRSNDDYRPVLAQHLPSGLPARHQKQSKLDPVGFNRVTGESIEYRFVKMDIKQYVLL